MVVANSPPPFWIYIAPRQQYAKWNIHAPGTSESEELLNIGAQNQKEVGGIPKQRIKPGSVLGSRFSDLNVCMEWGFINIVPA